MINVSKFLSFSSSDNLLNLFNAIPPNNLLSDEDIGIYSLNSTFNKRLFILFVISLSYLVCL